MAEIHVQTKKGSGNSSWIWIVVVLIIIGAVVYYLLNRNKAATTATPPANSTSAIQYFAGGQATHKFLLPTAITHFENNIYKPKALLS